MMPNDLSVYDFYRPQLQTGDLLAYRANTVVGTLIHLWSRPYNHVGMVLRLPEYEGQENRRWTLAADHRGVALSLLSTELEHYPGEAWWYPLRATEGQRAKIAEFGLCQAGKEYDYEALIKNVWGLVPVDLRKYFCSEYVFDAYRSAGLVQGEKAPRPSELAKLPLYLEPTQLIFYALQNHPPLEP